MKTITITEPINLKVVKFELDFSSLHEPKPKPRKRSKEIKIPQINCKKLQKSIPNPPQVQNKQQKNVKELIEELLNDIYSDHHDWTSTSGHGSTTAASFTSSQSNCGEQTDSIEISYLESLDVSELNEQVLEWKRGLQIAGERLAKCLRLRDRLYRQQKKLCAAFTVLLRHINEVRLLTQCLVLHRRYAFCVKCTRRTEQMSAILNSLRNLASSAKTAPAGDANARFGVTPGSEGPGEGGFTEWLHAMRLVARLPAGVPQHFRRKLWLTLAERHLTARGVDWPAAERACFRGTAQPDDTELSAQILKDLHRTGCSLFCGVEGRENQAMLRRVLLAYARWNKDVGYCQGFNMLAAIILEVMDKSEPDSLKVMIYLVEAVLPEGYFADDLRGLSADMAAFRDLLRLRLPRLAQHMDHLQRISDGGGVEPPLPDVFTMQWFLTLYATWLPRESLLRIWDLILLDGNEVLLLTALAIWDMLQDRILSARSADEFYSCMGGGVGAVWEAGESLVVRVVAFNSAPELPRLRSLHRYRVAPPAPPNAPPIFHPPCNLQYMQSMTKRGLRLFYSEDEGDSSDEGNKMALATVAPRREERSDTGDRLSLDIGALKRQYARLRERQRQAHVILAAACARHAAVGVPTSPTSLTVNNLLLGKSAIVSSRGRRLGPPPGAIPPSRQTTSSHAKSEHYKRKPTNDTISWEEEKSRKSLNRRNSVKWKDIKRDNALDLARKASIDLDETGDGIIVSEIEANQMIASMRSRSSSETSSYSSRSASSTDTSLCDENEKASDSETDLPNDDKENNIISAKNKINLPTSVSSLYTEKQSSILPIVKETPKLSSPISNKKPISEDKTVKNITDYLDSAAGEPLRVYIDGFEKKLKDSAMVSNDRKSYTAASPIKVIRSPQTDFKSNNVLMQSEYEHRNNQKNTNLLKSKNKIQLSPIDLSPHHSVIKFHSPTNDRTKFETRSPFKSEVLYTPPDIIDTFASYPNFVPDIDLSDKYISDTESPLRSPGSESLIVSEDEPPIPLKIDKYFEHSPEFFGARLTDPNSSNIPSRRATKRNSRLPKKPDSLILQRNNSGKVVRNEAERASSLPQTHTFICKKSVSPEMKEDNKSRKKTFQHTEFLDKQLQKIINEDITVDIIDENPKEYVLRSGRKNSERALQIIQENSQILSRILTKQNSASVCNTTKEREIIEHIKTKVIEDDVTPTNVNKSITDPPVQKGNASKLLLKESTSDSLIGCMRRPPKCELEDKNEFLRERPISIDDPFSFEVRNVLSSNDEFDIKTFKTPSIECLVNKTDLYGWENKGFLAKCDFTSQLNRQEILGDDYKRKTDIIPDESDHSTKNQNNLKGDWSSYSFSEESKISVTLPSSEIKDTSSYDHRYTSDDYNYPMTNSSKYNDFDICSNILDRSPKICDNLIKTENSPFSDFSHKVTSSISFTCDQSIDDDSPIGAKSNSSDTLCQITSLDQVSTPISPKIFPNRETPILSKDSIDISDTIKLESDDTCSAITSLLETDTLSSLSYPRSPSTGSYHPFPTRPAIRLPKDLGIKLGMYPKESFHSPQK